MDQKRYWDDKIISWEKSTYGKETKGLDIIEKLATGFRRSNRERAKLALKILEKKAKNKRILELGCGSGVMTLKLLEIAQPKEIIGIDIAPKAIQVAQERAAQQGLATKMNYPAAERQGIPCGKVRFLPCLPRRKRMGFSARHKIKFKCGDVRQIKLPACDVCFGLGFLNYLTLEEIRVLFRKLKAKNILFSFAKKELSIMYFLHRLYTQLTGCPGHYFYTKKEIEEALGTEYGKIFFIKKGELAFDCIFHNFV